MKAKLFVLLGLLFLSITIGTSQTDGGETVQRKHFIGSTLFVLLTPVLDKSPQYYQLNYGYRLSPRDVLSLEAITWTYWGPLGRPYGPDMDNEASDFPGKVRAFGAGLAYKRFLWKQMYTQIHATAFRQQYLDPDGTKIQSGFQLFNALRFGYHINLLRKRWFIEPSIAFTSWPINTNLPDSFQVEEDKWPKYFLFEPGLHFGFNF